MSDEAETIPTGDGKFTPNSSSHLYFWPGDPNDWTPEKGISLAELVPLDGIAAIDDRDSEGGEG